MLANRKCSSNNLHCSERLLKTVAEQNHKDTLNQKEKFDVNSQNLSYKSYLIINDEKNEQHELYIKSQQQPLLYSQLIKTKKITKNREHSL